MKDVKGKTLSITTLMKLYTMLLLSEGPRYGYELIKELSRMTTKPVSPAQVYPFLRELEKAKHIKISEKGEREKKVYKLTGKGEKFSKSFITRLSHMLEAGIKARLVKCEHCGCEIYSGGYMKGVSGKIKTFCCRACARAF